MPEVWAPPPDVSSCTLPPEYFRKKRRLGAQGGKGWCEGTGSRTYRESHCRGRGGSGCRSQHKCWALGRAPHSAGCGFGLRPRHMNSTQTTATSLLWVVGWDELTALGAPSWGRWAPWCSQPLLDALSTWAGLCGTQCLLRVQPKTDILAWGGCGAGTGPCALVVAATTGG